MPNHYLPNARILFIGALGIKFSEIFIFTPVKLGQKHDSSWWRHQMETFSASLAFCAGNSPVTGEFPSQRPVTQSFDVFFYLRLNKQQSKQSWSWWFETPSRPLWRHCNVDDLASCLTRLSSVVVLINSLTPGRCPRNFDRLIFKCITQKLVKLFSCECHRCLPMRSQHWS